MLTPTAGKNRRNGLICRRDPLSQLSSVHERELGGSDEIAGDPSRDVISQRASIPWNVNKAILSVTCGTLLRSRNIFYSKFNKMDFTFLTSFPCTRASCSIRGQVASIWFARSKNAIRDMGLWTFLRYLYSSIMFRHNNDCVCWTQPLF